MQTTSANVMAWAPRLLSVLRVVAALLFLQHGMQKLFGFPVAPASGLPLAFTLIWFAGVIEFVGSLLLLVGLFTRAVAFVLSGEMASAYWLAHAPRAPFPIMSGATSRCCSASSFLYLAVAGGGAWAVDRMRSTGI